MSLPKHPIRVVWSNPHPCLVGLTSLVGSGDPLDPPGQLFEGRLALNPGLNITRVSFSGLQKHFLG